MADLIERYKITANLPSVLMNYCNRFNSKQLESITEMIYELENSIESADVQPVNRWISVEDRLPESEKEVLVWYKYTWDAGFTSYGFGINVWYPNAKQWRDGCLLKGIEVLYWQPLPEPPKTGGEQND